MTRPLTIPFSFYITVTYTNLKDFISLLFRQADNHIPLLDNNINQLEANYNSPYQFLSAIQVISVLLRLFNLIYHHTKEHTILTYEIL